jgi:hypothetical protein
LGTDLGRADSLGTPPRSNRPSINPMHCLRCALTDSATGVLGRCFPFAKCTELSRWALSTMQQLADVLDSPARIDRPSGQRERGGAPAGWHAREWWVTCAALEHPYQNRSLSRCPRGRAGVAQAHRAAAATPPTWQFKASLFGRFLQTGYFS